MHFLPGFSYAKACSAELSAYEEFERYQWASPDATETTTWTSSAYTANATTLCDGLPRIFGNLTFVSTLTEVSTVTYTTSSLTYSGPKPSCTINLSDCGVLSESITDHFESYFSVSSTNRVTVSLASPATAVRYGNSILGSNSSSWDPVTPLPILTVGDKTYDPDGHGGYPIVFLFENPDLYSTSYLSPGGDATVELYSNPKESWANCETPKPTPTKASTTIDRDQTDDCGQCTIWGGTVDLLYFPVTTSAPSRDMCAMSATNSGMVCPYGSTVTSVGDLYEACSYASMNMSSPPNSGQSQHHFVSLLFLKC